MKILVLSVLLCFSSMMSPVEQPPLSQKLVTGSIVPDIKLKNLQNYPKRAIHLSELYKDKPLIIAFWGTTCNTCLKSLPLLDSLHKALRGSFNILSVTEDDEADVKAMFQNTAILKNIDLPYITNDKIMSGYFEHRYLPHIVWINKKGVVAAITAEEDVTMKNLNDLVTYDTIALFEKNDDMLFDQYKLYAPPDVLVEFKSLLSSYNSNIRAAGYVQADRDDKGNIDSVERVLLVNTRPVNLFYKAFIHLTSKGSYDLPLYNRIVFNVTDSALYYHPDASSEPAGSAWKKDQLYCYELRSKKLDRVSFYRMMFDDINRYFPIKGSIEKRMMSCYVLTRLKGNKGSFQSQGGTKALDNHLNEQTGKTDIAIHSLPLSSLALILNWFSLNRPIVVDSSLNEPVDLDISLTIKDHEWNVRYDAHELKTELNKYGLTLIEEKREMEVLVLSDK